MAGEPLPNLSTVDIEIARIRRNNEAYRQQVEAQRLRQQSWQGTTPAPADNYDFSQEAYKLRNNLRPPIPESVASPLRLAEPARLPQSVDARIAEIQSSGFQPIDQPIQKSQGSIPDRVGLRNQPSSTKPPPTANTAGRPVYPANVPQNVRAAEPRQPLFQKPKLLINPLPFADPPTVGTVDIAPGPKMPASLPALPIKGIPRALGVGARAAGPALGAVGAGVDAARRIGQGQDAGQVVGGVAGGLAGGYAGALGGGQAGAAAGALLGPAGAAVGGVLGMLGGGAVGALGGGALADQLTGAGRPSAGLPRSADLPPPSRRQIPAPGSAGQLAVGYLVTIGYKFKENGEEKTGLYDPQTVIGGPLGGLEVVEQPYAAGFPQYTRVIVSQPGNGTVIQVIRLDAGTFAITSFSIRRADGRPDYDGSTPMVDAPYPSGSPGRNLYVGDLPSSARPAGTPNTQGAPNPHPSGLPAGGQPRGDSPNWVSGGSPAPSSGTGGAPGTLVPGLPESGSPNGGGSPNPSRDPSYRPDTRRLPGGSTGSSSGGFSPGLSPALLAPLALSPMVRGNARPTRFRQRSPFKQPDPPNFNFGENSCNIDPCMAGLQRQSQRTSEQVGGIDQRLAALQTGIGLGGEAVSTAAILARLDKIDAKLGPQIANGGIGNFVKKTWDFLQIDRVLAVFTFITTLHNAYHLSSGLTQTLFSALSNSLAVFGVDDAEGQPLDINAIASKWTDQFFKSIFGVEQVDGFKAQWRRFNNIFRAASNVISSVQSLVYSVQSILEVLGQNIAKIGNALKAWGSVSDRAYTWMSEASGKPGILGAFDRVRDKTQAIEEITSNIDGVASEVLGARETLAEFERQTEELAKLQREGLPKPQIENLPIKQANDAAKAVSQSPPITSGDLVKPEV